MQKFPFLRPVSKEKEQKQTPLSPPTEEDYYIFGIDFGTTFSGVAWSLTGTKKIPAEAIEDWPSGDGIAHKGKTPSQIFYDPDDKTIHWGYKIPSSVEPIRWFKLLLEDEDELDVKVRESAQLQHARQQLQELNKTAVQVTADYLRCLWRHVLSELHRERGELEVKGTPFKIRLTVPAIWSLTARRRMEKAARIAGLLDERAVGATVLSLIAEPEAAAIAALQDLGRKWTCQDQDFFIVCDAGGGTVDLISYEVLQSSPLQIRECVQGQGKMCGAIFIDERFERYLKRTLGPKWDKIDQLSKQKMIDLYWENGIKKAFTGDGQTPLVVTLPITAFTDEDFKNKQAGDLVLQSGHIKGCFSQALDDIKGLIEDQVSEIERTKNKLPKAIVLVGGLGNCRYLHNALSPAYSSRNIHILQPSGSRPWTAVCRGAASSNINTPTQPDPIIATRISRHSYGVRCSQTFDERVHSLADKFWCEEFKEHLARDQVMWFLKQGDDISDIKPVRHRIEKRVFEDQPASARLETVICTDTNPTGKPPSGYADTHGEIMTINFPLPAKISSLPKVRPKGALPYRLLVYEVLMTATGTSLSFKIEFNDRTLGEHDIRVKYRFGDTQRFI